MKSPALTAIFLSFFCLVNLSWGETDIKELTRRAESGDSEAQFDLGYMYSQGEGVTKNVVKAYVRYSTASANGNEKAKENLEILRPKMNLQQVGQAQNEAGELLKRFNESKK